MYDVMVATSVLRLASWPQIRQLTLIFNWRFVMFIYISTSALLLIFLVCYSLQNTEKREGTSCLGLLIFFSVFAFILWAVFIYGSPDKGKRIMEFYFGALWLKTRNEPNLYELTRQTAENTRYIFIVLLAVVFLTIGYVIDGETG